jgi:hypothetical protein
LKAQRKKYDDQVAELKEKDKKADDDGEEGPDLASLGPPFVRLWATFVQEINK